MAPRTPRSIMSSPRALAAIPLAALAVVGSLTAAGQRTTTPIVSTSSPSTKAAPPVTPAPQPLAPVAVAPTTQDAATAATATARTAATVAVTTSDIPAAALAAYQRAATTIDSAAPGCHLDWTLLAAIGKVESNHGGGHLDAKGVAQPAIIGPALTGQNGTALVPDTDGGVYDGDTTYDHAVGPMQILPSTWAAVGVDADGDGKRNPQDINDAALGAAVYLCSGGGDLATPAGQQAAALRYNPAQWYADEVVAIAHAYATSKPADPVQAFFITARAGVPGELAAPTPLKGPKRHRAAAATTATHHHGQAAGGGPASTPTTGAGSVPPTPAPGAGSGGSSSTTPPPAPGTPTPAGSPTPPAPTTPAPPAAATKEQLATLCSPAVAQAYPAADAATQQQATDLCVQKLTGMTADDARAGLPAVVADLPKTYPSLQPTTASDPASGSAGAGSAGGAGSTPSSGTPSSGPSASTAPAGSGSAAADATPAS